MENLSNPLNSFDEIKNLYFFITKIFIFYILVMPNIIKNDDLKLQMDFKNNPNFPINYEFDEKLKNLKMKTTETLIENNYYRMNFLDFNNKLILQVFLVNKISNFLNEPEDQKIYEFEKRNKIFEMKFLIDYDFINISNIKELFYDYYKNNIDYIKKKLKFSDVKDKHYVFFLKLKKNNFFFVLFFFNKKKNRFLMFYEIIKKNNNYSLNPEKGVFDKIKIDEFFNFFRIFKNEINEEDFPFILNFLVDILLSNQNFDHNYLKEYLDTHIFSNIFNYEIQKNKFIKIEILFCEFFLFFIFKLNFFGSTKNKKIIFYRKKLVKENIIQIKKNIMNDFFMKNFFDNFLYIKDNIYYPKKLQFFDDDKIFFSRFN